MLSLTCYGLALLALLLSAQRISGPRLFGIALLYSIDFSGALGSSAINTLLNGAKLTVIPLLLASTLPRGRRRPLVSALLAVTLLFIALNSYRGDFPTSGLYFTLYLIGWLLLLRFGAAFAAGRPLLSRRTLMSLAYLPLALGLTQTFFLGNGLGTAEDRFTGFLSPQAYAEGCVMLGAFVLAAEPVRRRQWPLVLPVVFAVTLSGSRTAAFGFAIVLALMLTDTRRRTGSRVPSAVSGVVLVLIAGLVLAIQPDWLGASSVRYREVSEAVTSGQGLSAIGTYRFRTEIREATRLEIDERSGVARVLGAGTGSIAEVVLRANGGYQRETVDANRVSHNEYLRFYYEQGLIGLLLIVLFLLGLVWQCMRDHVTRPAAAPVLAALLLFAGLENVSAESGTTVGLFAALAFTWKVQNVSAGP